MELIKKIKETEVQAQQIIAKAKTDAVSAAGQWKQKKRQNLEKYEQDRRKAIEEAVVQAEKQGQADVGKLKDDARKQREDLRQSTASKIDNAVNKVVTYIKG